MLHNTDFPIRARTRGVRCAAWPTSGKKRMLTLEARRSLQRGHLSSQGNTATLPFCTFRYSPLARARAYARRALRRLAGIWKEKTHVNLETQSATAKGSLQFPRQNGTFSIPQNAELPIRARGVRCAAWQTSEKKTHVTMEIPSATAKGQL